MIAAFTLGGVFGWLLCYFADKQGVGVKRNLVYWKDLADARMELVQDAEKLLTETKAIIAKNDADREAIRSEIALLRKTFGI